MNKYKRVTYEDRCQIFALLKTDKSKAEVAKILNFHRSSIHREIKRNSTRTSLYKAPIYSIIPAQKLSRERRKRCRRKLLVQGDLENWIQDMLAFGWSPEQIAGRIRHELKRPMSTRSIYRYTRRLPHLKRYLLHKGYRWPKSHIRPLSWAIRNKQSIHDRPTECVNRIRIGDWERDTMFVKNREAMLICTDRKSRYTKIAKLSELKSDLVNNTTLELLHATAKPIHTITNDNGVEFTPGTNQLFKEKKVYYCEPRRPDQRGTVENTIGVIRRVIKQDTDIERINVPTLETWINFRPRKVLDFRTPHEVFYETSVALAMAN